MYLTLAVIRFPAFAKGRNVGEDEKPDSELESTSTLRCSGKREGISKEV